MNEVVSEMVNLILYNKLVIYKFYLKVNNQNGRSHYRGGGKGNSCVANKWL
jgi:hypothetical protein